MQRTALFLAAMILAGASARAEDLKWTFNWTPSNVPSNLRLIKPSSSTKLSHLCLTNEPLTRPPVRILGVEIPEALSAPARQWHSAWEDGIRSLKLVFAQD